MSARVAWLIAVALTATAPRALAVPRVYKLETSACRYGESARTGTGFVVRGFVVGGQTPNVLVTALHVVNGCEDIQVWDLACHEQEGPKQEIWAVPPGGKILIWPTLDLAVILLPGNPLRLTDELVAEQLDLEPATLAKLKKQDDHNELVTYQFPATTDDANCLRGGVDHVSLEPSKRRFEQLASAETHRQHKTITADQLRGYVSPSAWLLNYTGRMNPGASGAPVTRDGNKVLAIHDAGFTDRNTGWGIVFPGSGLDQLQPKFVVTKAMPNHESPWPNLSPLQLQQSASSDVVAADKEVLENAKRVRSQNLLSILFGGNTHELETGGASVQLDYSIHGLLGYTRLGYFKLGVQTSVLGGWMRVPRDFLSPGGDELEHEKRNLTQLYVAPGVDLRLDRLNKRISPSLAFGGLLGGWFFANETLNVAAPSQLDIGLWANLRNRTMLRCTSSGCFHFVLGALATLQRTPNFDLRYTGVGANVERAGKDRYMLYLGLLVGVEWFGIGG